MEVTVKLKVKPFRIPNFVLADKQAADASNDTKFALSDLDADTLERLCEQFTKEVFKKAGKQRPARGA